MVKYLQAFLCTIILSTVSLTVLAQTAPTTLLFDKDDFHTKRVQTRTTPRIVKGLGAFLNVDIKTGRHQGNVGYWLVIAAPMRLPSCAKQANLATMIDSSYEMQTAHARGHFAINYLHLSALKAHLENLSYSPQLFHQVKSALDTMRQVWMQAHITLDKTSNNGKQHLAIEQFDHVDMLELYQQYANKQLALADSVFIPYKRSSDLKYLYQQAFDTIEVAQLDDTSTKWLDNGIIHMVNKTKESRQEYTAIISDWHTDWRMQLRFKFKKMKGYGAGIIISMGAQAEVNEGLMLYIDNHKEIFMKYCVGGDHSTCAAIAHDADKLPIGTWHEVEVHKVGNDYHIFFNGNYECTYETKPVIGDLLIVGLKAKSGVEIDYIDIIQ